MVLTILSAIALGRAIRDARRRAGLTQVQLAAITGLRQPAVSNLERGAGHASFETVLRVLAVLRLEFVLREIGDGSQGEIDWESEA